MTPTDKLAATADVAEDPDHRPIPQEYRDLYSHLPDALKAREELVAMRRAETLTGADYYVAALGSDPNDLEHSFRLEVSGTDSGDMSVVRQRLMQKQAQARAGRSNLPAIAAVVGFKAVVVAIARVEDL